MFTELIFTIALPVFILNKGSNYFGDNGPLIALLVALSCPVIYFFWDLYKTKHRSIISIFGFVNILLTGGFALYQLNSHWYAIKEMLFPLLIGLGILYTSFTEKPVIRRVLDNENMFNVELLKQRLTENNGHGKYKNGLKLLTKYLAITFFVSSAINYFLSINIIVDLPVDLATELKLKLRNEQIADLTWKAYFVILIPSIVMMSFIMWRTSKLLKECTQLSFEELTSKEE
jgi:hypothetical protein